MQWSRGQPIKLQLFAVVCRAYQSNRASAPASMREASVAILRMGIFFDHHPVVPIGLTLWGRSISPVLPHQAVQVVYDADCHDVGVLIYPQPTWRMDL